MSGMLAACAADFRERTRRFSFWAMAALCLFAAFLFVPNNNASFRVLVLDSHIYAQATNPSWLPMSSALCAGLLLPLLGFAFVKNAIGGDRENGLLPLLHSLRFPRLGYVMGKFLSNCGLLLALLGVLALGAAGMAVLRFPGQWLPLWAWLSPFLALVPGLVFTAALAVFCETLPLLRTKAGGVVAILGIFAMQVVSITAAISPTLMKAASAASLFDIAGYRWLFESIHQASIAATGRPIESSTILGGGSWIQDSGTAELVFHGLPLNTAAFAGTVTLLACGCLLVLASALLLERRPLTTAHKGRHSGQRLSHTEQAHPLPAASASAHWAPATTGPAASPFRLAATEMRRLAKAVPPVWALPALGLFAAMCFAPLALGTSVLLPLLYGWAIPLFAAMGSEEKSSGIDSLLRTIEGAPVRGALAGYVAGGLGSLLLVAPLLLRMVGAGQLPALAALMAFALLVPAVALTLGGLTHGPRAFQIICIIVLYILLNAPDAFFPQGPAALAKAGLYLLCAAAALALLLVERLRAQR